VPLDPGLFRDAPGRFERFKPMFDALDELGDVGTSVPLTTRGDMDALLPRLMMAALGKALKTLQAIQRLCLFGFGEDAALLLRSNINLLINLNYIARDDEPNERARDLLAHTQTSKRKNTSRRPRSAPDDRSHFVIRPSRRQN
jgi:hypothetical protein